MRYVELPLSAQTAYAELLNQTQDFELSNALGGLVGSFHKRTLKGRDFWYFGYRDIDQRLRMAYVGPDSERTRRLVERFAAARVQKPLVPAARMAIAAGCVPVAAKHFRIIKRLAEYGFFRAGGVLIGTHAFLALGNMLGVRWRDGTATLDIDFAHAGPNVSLGLPAELHIDVHAAIESLEMGLLPMNQFDGRRMAEYRNPRDPELRIDFLTSMTRNGDAVTLPALNLCLQPLKFMELSLEGPAQACVMSNAGACIVNLPAPERYALHKLIVYGERPASSRAKASKDLLQAASLIAYFLDHEQVDTFNAAWRDVIARGKVWKMRAEEGRRALRRLDAALASGPLWAGGD
jgi:hypothetical protein